MSRQSVCMWSQRVLTPAKSHFCVFVRHCLCTYSTRMYCCLFLLCSASQCISLILNGSGVVSGELVVAVKLRLAATTRSTNMMQAMKAINYSCAKHAAGWISWKILELLEDRCFMVESSATKEFRRDFDQMSGRSVGFCNFLCFLEILKPL